MGGDPGGKTATGGWRITIEVEGIATRAEGPTLTGCRADSGRHD